MKRCVVTFLNAEDRPIFDLMVYGITRDEFMDAYGFEAMDKLDQRLRQRNMTLADFPSIQVTEPQRVPTGSVPRIETRLEVW